MTDLATGGVFQYQGLLEGQGAGWALTVQQTNDPSSAIGIPIATQVSFDGATLHLENSYEQASSWQKYR